MRLLCTLMMMIVAGLAVAQAPAAPASSKKDEKKKPNPVVEMKTSMGDIQIEVFKNESPISANNFLAYVEAKYYDGLIFHRVIKGFCVQGGGFEPGMQEKKTIRPPVPNESHNGVKNAKGTLALARKPHPHSAQAQFFFNMNDNTNLNWYEGQAGYSVFGKVIKGWDVVEKMETVTTVVRPPYRDVPEKDITIVSVKLLQK